MSEAFVMAISCSPPEKAEILADFLIEDVNLVNVEKGIVIPNAHFPGSACMTK